MKKKRLFTFALTAALGLSLAACGGDTGASATPTPAPSEPATTAPSAGADIVSSPAPAAEDDWSYIEGKGELVIGYTVFEPMNYTDDEGNFTGFETEFAQAVCAKLGVTPKFQEINWDTKVIELDAKTIDCIWNGMTINEDLKENISISRPYMTNYQALVIRAADAGTYTSTADLIGKKITAEIGSAGEQAIQADENLSQATYTGASKQTEALLEVKSNASDAAVMDYVLTSATIGEGTDYADLTILDVPLSDEEQYGIGLRKGSTATEKINEAIQALIDDGTLQTIAEKYNLADRIITD